MFQFEMKLVKRLNIRMKINIQIGSITLSITEKLPWKNCVKQSLIFMQKCQTALKIKLIT